MNNVKPLLRLRVAGRDRSEDLGKELIEASRQRPDFGLSRQIVKETDVLALKSAGKMSDYLDRHVTLVRSRNCVDTAFFDVPAKPGIAGRVMYLIRRFFWKVLRHQHDWMTFHQNSINVQLAYELEFEKEAREREIKTLQKRLNKLESAVDKKADGERRNGP